MTKFTPLLRMTALLCALVVLISSCKDDTTEPDGGNLPVLTTTDIQDITSVSAVGGGQITSDGGASITDGGLIRTTLPHPDIGNNEGMGSEGAGTGYFSVNLTSLIPYTRYYVRAYASNAAGTGYGNQVEFETLPEGAYGTVKDIDGNTYWTVKIGDYEWMAQNLRVSKFADGTPIATGLTQDEWKNTTNPAYGKVPPQDTLPQQKFLEPTLVFDDYGYLYNAFSVLYGNNPCPEGWYVPSNQEWDDLETLVAALYSGGVGDALKSCRQVNSPLGGGCKTIYHPRWDEDPTSYGVNKLLFLALPAGFIDATGFYQGLGTSGYFWTSTESVPGYTFRRHLTYDKSGIYGGVTSNGAGYSVRCYRPLLKGN